MNGASLPHYTAFRIVLIAVMVVLLGVTVWMVADPSVLASLYRFLGLELP